MTVWILSYFGEFVNVFASPESVMDSFSDPVGWEGPDSDGAYRSDDGWYVVYPLEAR